MGGVGVVVIVVVVGGVPGFAGVSVSVDVVVTPRVGSPCVVSDHSGSGMHTPKSNFIIL